MRRAYDLSKLKRAGDEVMEGGLPTDAVVLVMGPTGAGKSTFLRNVLAHQGYNGPMPAVGHGLRSCTGNLMAYVIPSPKATMPDQRLVLVDTPGFDDTSVSDSEILRRIAVWLASSYDAKMRLGGVIYMFPIFPNKITRNDTANLKVFKELCGDEALVKVMMVTTKWALCQEKGVCKARETDLKDHFWKDMLRGGSGLSRLEDAEISAMQVLNELLERRETAATSLALQDEIVIQCRRLPKTQAGQELKAKLKQLLREHKASSSGDYQTRQQKLQNIVSQLNDLKIPFSDRIKALFGLA